MSPAAPTVTKILDSVSAPNRADARRVHQLIRKTAPDLRPFAMGRMLGYGKFRYRYATGREGESAVIALADRVGKSCIRFKKLADRDEATLVALVREARAPGGAAEA